MSSNKGQVQYNPDKAARESSSHGFAEHVAEHIADRLRQYAGRKMCVRSYLPKIADQGETAGGYIEIAFVQEDGGADEIKIGVQFGKRDPEKGYPLIQGFDHSEWLAGGRIPTKNPVSTFNFNEAWQLICLVGIAMNVSGISIQYGTGDADATPRLH